MEDLKPVESNDDNDNNGPIGADDTKTIIMDDQENMTQTFRMSHASNPLT